MCVSMCVSMSKHVLPCHILLILFQKLFFGSLLISHHASHSLIPFLATTLCLSTSPQKQNLKCQEIIPPHKIQIYIYAWYGMEAMVLLPPESHSIPFS